MQQASWDIIYLISCALHGNVPEEERVRNMDMAVLFQIAKKHMLTAIAAMALESFWDKNPPANKAVWHPWEQEKVCAMRRNLLLDTEREQILNFFEKNEIWYMPLKGCILKELYPQYGMRQMADNDILFDGTYRREVLKFMKQRGYKVQEYEISNQDVYMKEPLYNFELHVALFGKIGDKSWVKYYADVKNRLLPDDHKKYGFHFRDEDFYVYITTHAYKHFKEWGTGLRTLLDSYVYLWRKKDKLDWDYIAAETRKLGIAGFEEQSRMLAAKLFSDQPPVNEADLTKEEQELFYYCFASGTYGTREHRISNRIKEIQPDGQPLTLRTKLRYCLERMFPTKNVVKYRWQLPFYWIGRMFRLIFTKRRNISYEMKKIWKYNSEPDAKS